MHFSLHSQFLATGSYTATYLMLFVITISVHLIFVFLLLLLWFFDKEKHLTGNVSRFENTENFLRSVQILLSFGGWGEETAIYSVGMVNKFSEVVSLPQISFPPFWFRRKGINSESFIQFIKHFLNLIMRVIMLDSPWNFKAE